MMIRAKVIRHERSVSVMFSPDFPERSEAEVQMEAAREFERVVREARERGA
jgi:hypothetical protein